jgi:hypothetical protein
MIKTVWGMQRHPIDPLNCQLLSVHDSLARVVMLHLDMPSKLLAQASSLQGLINKASLPLWPLRRRLRRIDVAILTVIDILGPSSGS